MRVTGDADAASFAIASGVSHLPVCGCRIASEQPSLNVSADPLGSSIPSFASQKAISSYRPSTQSSAPSGPNSGSSAATNSSASDSSFSGISGWSVMAYSNRQETAPRMAQYGAIGTQNRKQSATVFTIRNTKRPGRLDGRLVGNQPE